VIIDPGVIGGLVVRVGDIVHRRQVRHVSNLLRNSLGWPPLKENAWLK